MRQDRFLEIVRQLGHWRCDTKNGSGKGSVKCPGDPWHYCVFSYHISRRVKSHKLESKKLVRWFW